MFLGYIQLRDREGKKISRKDWTKHQIELYEGNKKIWEWIKWGTIHLFKR